MTISVQIYPERNFVMVRCTGYCRVAEHLDAFERYRAHPDYHSGQLQLFDLSGVTGFERNYPAFIGLQARLADAFGCGLHDDIVVFVAPTDTGREMAQMVIRSWTRHTGLVISLCETIGQALDILGLDKADIPGI